MLVGELNQGQKLAYKLLLRRDAKIYDWDDTFVARMLDDNESVLGGEGSIEAGRRLVPYCRSVYHAKR